MLYERDAKGSVDEVCAKLTQAAADNKFGVLGVHDLKQKMADKGVPFGPQCRILEVCNPHQAKAVLEANPSISTALPCRIAVYEHAGKTTVSTLKPTVLLSLFGNPELQPVARDVETAIVRMINAACT
ncbi:MAG TPA: DUF302 domain-containing protein [Phycisphaerae bacterium]|nr:DUF302 domain-containing protein [Phycisphaerae bacterium]